MFYRSLTPIEQAHIVEAITFELGKVYEQAIKERELAVLANVDADSVCPGRGRTRPRGSGRVAPASDVVLSPALSQLVDDAGTDRRPGDRRRRRRRLRLRGHPQARPMRPRRLGAKVLVIAPVGGVLKRGRTSLAVDRTLLTTRSVEYDAVLVAAGTTPSNDIKLVLLLQEAYRHCKAMGAWGDATGILEDAGIGIDGPGVVTGDVVDRSFTVDVGGGRGNAPGVGAGRVGDVVVCPAVGLKTRTSACGIGR